MTSSPLFKSAKRAFRALSSGLESIFKSAKRSAGGGGGGGGGPPAAGAGGADPKKKGFYNFAWNLESYK